MTGKYPALVNLQPLSKRGLSKFKHAVRRSPLFSSSVHFKFTQVLFIFYDYIII